MAAQLSLLPPQEWSVIMYKYVLAQILAMHIPVLLLLELAALIPLPVSQTPCTFSDLECRKLERWYTNRPSPA